MEKEEAIDFVQKCREDGFCTKKKRYEEGEGVRVLEDCIVIKDGRLKQVNLKKGNKKNYDDVFNLEEKEVKVVFALKASRDGVFSLANQKKACEKAKDQNENVSLNIAIWKYESSSYPDMEQAFQAKVKEVLDTEVILKLTKSIEKSTERKSMKRKAEGQTDLLSFWKK